MVFFNKHKQLHECQFGFRHKHSFQSALIKLIVAWSALTAVIDWSKPNKMNIDYGKPICMIVGTRQ